MNENRMPQAVVEFGQHLGAYAISGSGKHPCSSIERDAVAQSPQFLKAHFQHPPIPHDESPCSQRTPEENRYREAYRHSGRGVSVQHRDMPLNPHLDFTAPSRHRQTDAQERHCAGDERNPASPLLR